MLILCSTSAQYNLSKPPSLRTKRAHRFSVTAAVASSDARWLYTSGKEGSIIKWDLNSGRQVHTFHKSRPDKGKGKSRDTGELQGHSDEIWALAISPDGKYLASGGKDKRVGVWDVEKNVWMKGFGGHRDCISVSAPAPFATLWLYRTDTRTYDRLWHFGEHRRRCRHLHSFTQARTTGR